MEGSIATEEAAGAIIRPLKDEEEDYRRQSQSSSSQTTASINDLSDEDYKSIPTLDVDITVENGPVTCFGESAGDLSTYSRVSSFDWTKKFQSLVEEAPLLEATILYSSKLENGIQVASNTRAVCDVNTKRRETEEKDCEGPKKMECDWVDLELLEKGREFVRKNFFAVFLAHFIGIAFLLTVRPIQSLLLRTSALHRKENTLRRYVKLIMYLKKFYDSPTSIVSTISSSINQSADKCHNEISYIHKLQRNAAKNFKVYVPPPWDDLKLTTEEKEIYEAIQEDTKQLDEVYTNTKNMPKILFTVNPDVPLSQYDLVVVQYAFYGLLVQFPRVFGIYDKKDGHGNVKGLDGFIHLWAVLGHVFGLDERFNMCIARNVDPETNKLIFKHVFLYSFKTINESAMRLWRCMTSGSSRYFFFFRTKAMMLFMCKDVAQLENCKHLYSIMKPAEKFCYYWYKFIIAWVLWVPLFRILLNFFLKLSVRICQFFLIRAKKCESKWDSPTSVCVIDPILLKESDRKQ